jgi:Spy/CpxP family protein refolding chaperone
MNKTRAAGLLLAGILAAPTARAELDEPKQPQQLQRLQTELKLSEQQKQEVGKIFEETRPQMDALRKQWQELREKMRDRLKAVLTAEQLEKFDKLHQARREKRMEQMRGHATPQR